MSFTKCKVTFRNRILFEPAWGTYDMAVGEKIISAYSGPADPDAFGLQYPVPEEKTHKIIHSEPAIKLHLLYRAVRKIREGEGADMTLVQIWKVTRDEYPEEWLLPLEIAELAAQQKELEGLKLEVLSYLKNGKSKNPDIKRLVDNGLLVLES
jgi:phenylalanine-4-hydroxylase